MNEFNNTRFENKRVEKQFLERKRRASANEGELLTQQILRLIRTGQALTERDGAKYTVYAVEGVNALSGVRHQSVYLTDKAGAKKLTRRIADIRKHREALDQRLRDLHIEGSSYCFTGFRDKGMEEQIKALGGIVVSGVSAKTSTLIAKDVTEESAKLRNAKIHRTRIVTREYMQEILENY